jgi:hypothetical protein
VGCVQAGCVKVGCVLRWPGSGLPSSRSACSSRHTSSSRRRRPLGSPRRPAARPSSSPRTSGTLCVALLSITRPSRSDTALYAWLWLEPSHSAGCTVKQAARQRSSEAMSSGSGCPGRLSASMEEGPTDMGSTTTSAWLCAASSFSAASRRLRLAC